MAVGNDIIIVANRLIPRYSINEEPYDTAPYNSDFGTPIYSPLEFLKESGKAEVLLRIDTILINVTQTKNVVKTSVAGRNGTIKEYISDGDYLINISGEFVSPYPLVYPESDVSEFLELMKIGKQLPVANEFLERFKIKSIVVEDYSVSEKLGSRNSVPFSISAVSDTPEEITLNEIQK